MPVSWDGLGKLPGADHFTLAKARKRTLALKQHPWGEFRSLGQQLPHPDVTNLTAAAHGVMSNHKYVSPSGTPGGGGGAEPHTAAASNVPS